MGGQEAVSAVISDPCQPLTAVPRDPTTLASSSVQTSPAPRVLPFLQFHLPGIACPR